MIYQRFKKGGRVAKSPFLAKSVQKLLKKWTFFKKQPFLNRRFLRNGFLFKESNISYCKRQNGPFLSIVMFSYSKRQKSCTLIVI